MARLNEQNNSKERFKWKADDKIDQLIQFLSTYKSQMEFNNTDFNAEKVKQYVAIHKAKPR